ncbi:hypothetical protein CLOLEP_02522 [[Clostridium] leptum DSM 753]|uniref:Uncharacterized protein n=1 Tax=[Clostridium] leptum DSM 753 TaxID=428125 RepID=A7VVB0_9FIRM|nr:hypothetical protein CLOLEP_02522 [[Clostridium] leptum DSM 753]
MDSESSPFPHPFGIFVKRKSFCAEPCRLPVPQKLSNAYA